MEAWENKHTALDLIKALADTKGVEGLKVNIKDVTALLLRVIEFSEYLMEDLAQAQLDHVVLDEFGSETEVSMYLAKKYSGKAKAAVIENEILEQFDIKKIA